LLLQLGLFGVELLLALVEELFERRLRAQAVLGFHHGPLHVDDGKLDLLGGRIGGQRCHDQCQGQGIEIDVLHANAAWRLTAFRSRRKGLGVYTSIWMAMYSTRKVRRSRSSMTDASEASAEEARTRAMIASWPAPSVQT